MTEAGLTPGRDERPSPDGTPTAGEAAVPGLSKALKKPKSRRRAAMVLARMGPEAKAAVPELVEALSDEDPITRR